MNKKIIAGTALAATLISPAATAQQKQRSTSKAAAGRSHVYLGFSTGINNSIGIIGPQLDIAPISRLSVSGGVGLSTWGYKMYVEPRVYFAENNRGWAAGIGVTRNTGLTNFTTRLPTTAGDRDVVLDLLPKTNIMASAYHFWTLGRRNNRFYLQLGWSFSLEPAQYTVKNGYILTEDGKNSIKAIAPGGLVLGAGFSFALD